MDGGEDGRRGQVGVGVGAADAVLDMPAGGRPSGHAQADGAVVDAPGRRQRRVAVGLEAPVGVGVGAEQQQGIEQAGEHAAQGLLEQAAGRPVEVIRLTGQQVASGRVGQADMHVHAGAGQVVEGLGHEAGLHPMAVGHALDQALVAHGLVHGRQLLAVLQGDLHLARGVLGNRRARRDALGLAGGVEVLEEGFELLQLPQAVDLGAARAAAVGIPRRLWPAIAIAALVEQVELQLAGHHRVKALGLEALDHPHQHMPGVGDGGRLALLRVHADLQRGGGDAPPGQAHQAAGQRVGAAVDVADLPDQPGVLDVVAVDAQAEDGAGQRPAVLVHGEQLVAVQQLAARHAVGVEDEQLEQFDIGVVRQEVLGVLHGCE